MKVTRFDPTADLVLVPARVWGPLGDKRLSLALDTAATETHIAPEILDDLGYSPRDGERITFVLAIHVHDLPEGFGIDGLVGLSFLKKFNLEIRFAEGRLLVERLGI